MKYLLYLIIAFTVSIPAFAHTQELHHEEKLKISIPFGEEYDYKNIKVNRVIDGDTLQLENGERVQLIGIKAPEDEKMGQETMEFVKELMAYKGDVVKLETDVGERDKYDRLLAYAYKLVCLHPCRMRERKGYEYESFEDGIYIFVNATIIKSGYATPMTIPPNVKHAELFKELYEEARKQKKGLWK